MRTVRVPDALREHFRRVEEIVARYFAQRKDAPERGSIEIFGERYVLVRAASLSVEFFSLVRDLYGPERRAEADAFARNILYDLAHSLGRSDARMVHQRLNLREPEERLAAGPIHFSHTGWAFVDIHPESEVSLDAYRLVFDHPYSFEATAWIESGLKPDFPVCIMNAGYSSGWCEESYGVPMAASELLCRARGDGGCRFVMSRTEDAENVVEDYLRERPELASRARGFQVPDFFARKRVEEELRRAHDELEQRVEERTAELREANERLRQEMEMRQQMERQLLETAKMEAVGRLAGGIAHDFNNLMGVVIGHATLLERRFGANDGLLAGLREIREAGEQAVQLNHQLLDFSRMRMVSHTRLDLNAVIAETARMLERVIGEDIDLSLSLDEGIGTILADRAQMSQVIMNLAVNARDAMPSGGKLSISTEFLPSDPAHRDDSHEIGPGRWVLLRVADTGIGMDEATLAKAFDPFFTTKETGRGTGLGLASVYGIVSQFGGVIRASSRPDGGTTFRIYLPSLEQPPEDRPDRPRPSPRFDAGVEAILVVEDQEKLRRVVVEALVRQGYRVAEAAGPAEALELVSQGTPVELLLTDVVMPKMSGRVLAEKIREMHPGTRVLYMSGYTDDDVLRHGVERGTERVLPKPFTVEMLLEQVRRALEG